jgi:hypothetical protein
MWVTWYRGYCSNNEEFRLHIFQHLKQNYIVLTLKLSPLSKFIFQKPRVVQTHMKFPTVYGTHDRLCGLVVRVPGCRSWGPGSIPGATKFSEKQWVWNGVHSALWVQLTSYLEEKVAAPVKRAENTAVGIRHADHLAPLYPKKLALTSSTSVGRSICIVRLRTQTTEFVCYGTHRFIITSTKEPNF